MWVERAFDDGCLSRWNGREGEGDVADERGESVGVGRSELE